MLEEIVICTGIQCGGKSTYVCNLPEEYYVLKENKTLSDLVYSEETSRIAKEHIIERARKMNGRKYIYNHLSNNPSIVSFISSLLFMDFFDFISNMNKDTKKIAMDRVIHDIFYYNVVPDVEAKFHVFLIADYLNILKIITSRDCIIKIIVFDKLTYSEMLDRIKNRNRQNEKIFSKENFESVLSSIKKYSKDIVGNYKLHDSCSVIVEHM